MKSFILLALMFCSLGSSAQKNGVSGFGYIDNTYMLGNEFVNNYIAGGGGLAFNNNVMLGVHYGSFATDYALNVVKLFGATTTDLLLINSEYYKTKFIDSRGDTFSKLPIDQRFSVRDIDLFVNFNIKPKQHFQLILGIKTGISLFNFSITNLNSYDKPGIDYTTSSTSKSGFGWNFMPQIEPVICIAEAIKIRGIFGYRLVINGTTESIDGKNIPMIRDKSILNSAYLGIGISFGNFK